MDFAYLLKVLWRRKWIILLSTLLAAVLAFVFTTYQKKVYSSAAQYSTGISAQMISLAGRSNELFEMEAKLNNVIVTFKSPIVVGMISYRLLLHDLDKPAEAYHKLTQKDIESKAYKSIDFDKARITLREKINKGELLNSASAEERNLNSLLELYNYDYTRMLKRLTISRIQNTDYLEVICKSENPYMAADVVNRLGIEYVRFSESLSTERGKQSADTIASFMQLQQRKVDSLTRLLLQEKQNQGAIKPEELSAIALNTLNGLKSRVTEEKAKYNTAKESSESLKKQLDLLISGVTGNNNEEIVSLKNKRSSLLTELTRKGGTDAELQKQISELTRQIAAKSGSNSSTANQKRKEKIDDLNLKVAEQDAIVQASARNIAELEAQIREVSPRTNIGAGSEIKLSALQTQLGIETNQLSEIKEKFSQAQGLLKEVATMNFKQTLVGQPAVSHDSRKRFIAMAIGGFSMLFLSSLLFVFIQLVDTSIKTPSQFQRLTGLKLLTVTNSINLKKDVVASIISNNYQEADKTLLHESAFKESMRKLRYEIDNSGKKILLVTSTQPGEGKTVLIQALANIMKLSKKKVLIVDTNFSNNELTGFYQAQPSLEDSSKLGSNYSYENIKKIISPTPDISIDIIGCRGGNYTPSEMLPFNNILAHLSNLDSEYDYIILEGASLNHHADSKELAQYCDAVIAVFSAESSVKQNDEESIKYLHGLNDKFLGAVLNKVQLENVDM
jgi:polysaccharide biosynthesis transport protein